VLWVTVEPGSLAVTGRKLTARWSTAAYRNARERRNQWTSRVDAASAVMRATFPLPAGLHKRNQPRRYYLPDLCCHRPLPPGAPLHWYSGAAFCSSPAAGLLGRVDDPSTRCRPSALRRVDGNVRRVSGPDIAWNYSRFLKIK
jgi:hypothetical protein